MGILMVEVEYVRSTTYGRIGRWAYRWVGGDMGGGRVRT